jgi:Glycosyltransferase family 87
VSSVKQRWLVFFSIAICLAVHVSLFAAMGKFQSRKPDFAGLYQAGRAVDHERLPLLIDRFPSLNSDDFSVQTVHGTLPADTMHPPYELVIYAALALLKFRFAYPFWGACNLALLFSSVFLLRRQVPNLQGRYPYLLVMIATFFPVLVAAVQGQNSILLLFLLVISLNLLDRQKDFPGGFALSMGMFKFVLVIPILLWLIVERRWKSLVGFAVGCVVLLLTALSLVGTAGVEAYVQTLAGYGKAAPEQPGTESIMPNLRGLIHVIGSRIASGSALAVITLVVSIGLFIWIDFRMAKRMDLSAKFAAQVLLATLVSYHLYPHDATVLVLPALIFINSSLRPEFKHEPRTALIAGGVAIYLIPLLAPLQFSMPVIGVAALTLLLWVQYWPNSRTAAVTPS